MLIKKKKKCVHRYRKGERETIEGEGEIDREGGRERERSSKICPSRPERSSERERGGEREREKERKGERERTNLIDELLFVNLIDDSLLVG